MGSEKLRPENRTVAPASTAEIEFALVLARMIDSVKNDPEHLRAAIYELARQRKMGREIPMWEKEARFGEARGV